MSCCSDNWVVPGANPAIPPPEPPQLIISGNYNLVVANDPIANTDTLSLNPLIFGEILEIPAGTNLGTFQLEPLGITLTPPYHVIPNVKANYPTGQVPKVTIGQNTNSIDFSVHDAITGNNMNECVIDFMVSAYVFTSLPLVPKTFTFTPFFNGGAYSIGPGIYNSGSDTTLQQEITSQIPADYYFRNNRTGVKVTMSYAGIIYGGDLFPQQQAFQAGISKINNSLSNQIAFKYTSGTQVGPPNPLGGADWGTVVPNTQFVQVTNNVIFSENDQLWYSWAFTQTGVNGSISNLKMSLQIDYMGY